MASPRSASLTAWRRQAARRIAASCRATQAFVAGLPVRETMRPRTQDRWSIKDVLAHLLACDEETVRRRDPSHEYTVVQWLPAPGWTHEQEHLSEVKAWWRAEHRR